MPPMMNASATGRGENRHSLIIREKNSPMMPAGRKAISKFSANFRAAESLFNPHATDQIFTRYSHTTASMAPDWMAMLKTFSFSPLNSSKAASQDQMAGRRYRQKFREAFDKTHDECLDGESEIHD